MQIVASNLTKLYGENKGISGASFSIEKGERIAIIGHNGAGKSTLLKVLSGWLRPDSGFASVDGIDILHRQQLVKIVGFIPETTNLFEQFSVEYNLRLFAKLFQAPLSKVSGVLEEFDLGMYRDEAVLKLSKGLKQRVSIGRALLANPGVLLLDEPSAGLDPEMTKELYRLLKKINDSGKTIVFTSHRPDEIAALATRVMVLRQANLVFTGTASNPFPPAMASAS
jgi:ABC-type multidrug transport system ATPase subunit